MAAATSADPTGHTSLSPEPAEKSSGISGSADPAEAPLFQLAEADADEAVEKYDSPEAWMEADRKAMEAEEGGEFPAAEGWDEEAEREKYYALYDAAVEHRQARLEADGKLPMTTSRADNKFIEKMENRDELLKFAGLINGTMYESPDEGAATDGAEQKDIERREALRSYIRRHVAGTFSIGRDRKMGVKPSGTQEKATRCTARFTERAPRSGRG